MTPQPTLPLLSQQSFPHPLDHKLLVTSLNTAHDLLALAPLPLDDSTTPSLRISRLITGQEIQTLTHQDEDFEECAPTALGWRQDGRGLAVGWGDGKWEVVGRGGGSVRGDEGGEGPWGIELGARGFGGSGGSDAGEGGGRVVRVVGWGMHRLKRVRGGGGGGLSAGGREGDEDGFGFLGGLGSRTPDLPKVIATLDAARVLPKLSAIPSHGIPGARFDSDANKFTTQAAVDGVFETQKTVDAEGVDVLLVASDDDVRVMLDETVNIGAVPVESKAVLHACHEHSGTHAFLGTEETESGGQQVNLHLLDLPLEILGGPLLHVIATNTKRTQNLVSYITQTLRCMQHDYTTGLQFPTRLMNNINEELSEKEETPLPTQLFHLSMTGHFTPTILEWLTDIVKDTNHKRWHQAVDGMYSNLQNHLLVNLLPALDRLSIAISTLRGQAKFHDGSSAFAVEHPIFSDILEGVDALRLVAKRLQLLVIMEQRQFRAFSKWLRVQIDIGTAGPGSKSAVETEEREVANIDFPLVLAYLKGAMLQSKLAAHLLPRPGVSKGSLSKEQFFNHPLVKYMSFERTAEALKELDTFVDGPLKSSLLRDVEDPRALLNLPAIAVATSGHVRVAIERITHWQGKMLPRVVSHSLRFPEEVASPLPRAVDMCMQAEPEKASVRLRVLLINDGGDGAVYAHDTAYTPNDSSQILEQKTLATANPAPDSKILDAKFINHSVFIGLWRVADAYVLAVSICPDTAFAAQSDEPLKTSVIHQLSTDDAFVPESIVVGGRKGKKVCIAFGNEGKALRVFDLESGVVAGLAALKIDERRRKGGKQEEDFDMGM
ncbi:hypothetical protein MBLNU230_g1906t1 [Neophaeotheca triangularis]